MKKISAFLLYKRRSTQKNRQTTRSHIHDKEKEIGILWPSDKTWQISSSAVYSSGQGGQ